MKEKEKKTHPTVRGKKTNIELFQTKNNSSKDKQTNTQTPKSFVNTFKRTNGGRERGGEGKYNRYFENIQRFNTEMVLVSKST